MSTTTTPLIDLSLSEFAARLAARTPTPGGGSVAAHLASLGCALTVMAFRFTSGPKHAAVEAALAAHVVTLERLGARALELVDLDTRAYDAVGTAAKLPRASEAEQAARTSAMQAALRGALEVPFETLETAVRALRLAAAGAPDVNKNLASDAATGAWCLWGAAEGALYNVRINAGSLADLELARARLAAGESLREEARTLAESVRRAVEAKLA